MSQAQRGTWRNGKQVVHGWWAYQWAADKFTIELDGKDEITGAARRITAYGDSPEWGNWKLDRESAK
jgi:hypothetical protein